MTLLEKRALEKRAARKGKVVGSAGTKKAGRPKGTARAKKPISDDEFNTLIMYIEESSMKESMKKRYLRVSALSYYLGTRISELLLLTTADIRQAVANMETSLTNRTKTKKPRLLLFTRKSLDVIEDLFEEYLDPKLAVQHKPDHLLFHAPKNKKKPLNVTTWTSSFNKLLHEALGPLYSTHSFRKGYITAFAKNKTHPKVAMAAVGHSSVATTMLYYSPDEEDIRSALEQVR